MIVQNDFLKKIKDLGLNTYEAKLWTALLSRGVATAGELSDIANVPRSRSYDVLESLEKKGFIIMKIAKPIKYMAIPPAEVLERVKRKVKENAQEHEKTLEELRGSNVIGELELLHTQGIETTDPADITGSVRGRANVYNHLDYLVKDAKKNILFVTSEDGMIRKYEGLRRSLKKAKDRGVKITFAAPLTKKSEHLLTEIRQVADVKNVDAAGRVAIIDNKHVLFMLSDDLKVHPSFDIGVWVNTPYFANMLSGTLATTIKK
jgi:sugar-specific transcriptional regulator TrmB